MKRFRTIQKQSEITLVVNKSRFIGRCFPVTCEQEVQETLESIRKREWDATHHCYAYSIDSDGMYERYSDDGEPGGTAGLPMMEVLHRKQVVNVLTVVTRYFGGVLLGAGGLVRAYGKAASQAVEAAGIVQMCPCVRYALTLSYPRWNLLEHTLRQSALLENTVFTDQVLVTALVKEEQREHFERTMIECTDGRIQLNAQDCIVQPFPIE